MPWSKPYHSSRNQRLAPELYTHANRVCFLTIRAYRSRSPFVQGDLNRIVLQALREEQDRQQCRVFTFCLMPDHLHFLASPGRDGVSVLAFADQYKGKSTRESWTVGWEGKLWQPRYFDHIVRAEEDLAAISEYILNNPVRKGFANSAEEWPWSGFMHPLPG